MNDGPVTRVYWRHYSKYYVQCESVRMAAYGVQSGDGRGYCKTEQVIDADGNRVFVDGVTHSNPFTWADEVINDE